MSDLIPTTEQVRDSYRRTGVWAEPNGGKTYPKAFDQWLQAVKAEAWDEGDRAARALCIDRVGTPTNPYKETP